ncbi:MAG: hypothetical protein F6J90_20565 [Moorea sp. SIOASIH]|nr:hypothetical protein [Moorena sp. SIOASIH]
MGETTAVAHGGNPQDRAASPRPRCIAIFSGGQDAHPTHINSLIQQCLGLVTSKW